MSQMIRQDYHVDKANNLVWNLLLWGLMAGGGVLFVFFNSPEPPDSFFYFMMGISFSFLILQQMFYLRVRRSPFLLFLGGWFLSIWLIRYLGIWTIVPLVILLIYALSQKRIVNKNLFLLFCRKQDAEESSNELEGISYEDFRRFSRFLGSHGYVTDYARRESQWVLFMPHAAESVADILTPADRWANGSTIVITPTGDIQAHLSPKDEERLRRRLEANIDARKLEENVARRLKESFCFFSAGNFEEAIRTLGGTLKTKPALVDQLGVAFLCFIVVFLLIMALVLV